MKHALLTLLIVFFTGCSKDNSTPTVTDQLPAATTTGANTAGCIINGNILIPKNGSASFIGTPYGLELIKGNNFWPDKNDYWQLEIANNKDVDNNFGLVLWVKNMSTGNGDYIINQSNGELDSNGPSSNQIIAGVKKNGINKTYYSSVNSGVIKITRSDLSVGVSIYSGTFNCTLYNKDNPSDIIQVSDGRFDINNLTLNH
jgi:hypothetical protein